MSIWFWDRLISWDRCERHYAYLIALLCAMTGFFILMKPATSPNMPFNFPLLTWGAPMCTFWCILTVIVVTLQIHYQKRDQLKYSEPLKFASQALLMLVLLIYYDGSNVVQRYRFDLFGAKMLYDDALVALDESLLGWLCPRGQLALCLDEHPLIGVTTTFGAITAEILQLMYVSYYLWGNVLGGYLAWKYYIDMIYLNKDNTARNRKMHWRRIQMYLCAWVGGFLLNFIMNMFFPAVSPRIHLSSHYKNPVRGFFLGDWFRGAIAGAAAKTFSAFPSGHCGLSWLVPILAYRMRLKRYTQITAFAALLITMATLILRYHYFVDFLFSSVVIAFSSWFGGFHTQEAYDRCLQDDQDRASSRKRLPRSRDEDEVGDSDDDDDMVPLMDIKINTRDTITDQSNQSINQSINQTTERSDSIQDSDSPLPTSSAAIVRLTSQSNKV